MAACRRWRAENPVENAWAKYRCSARVRNLEFSIEKELLRDLVTDRCYYCGAASQPTNGIDRVDNSKGYVFGNVVTCCRTCNLSKSDRSGDEFLDWVRRVYSHSLNPSLRRKSA